MKKRDIIVVGIIGTLFFGLMIWDCMLFWQLLNKTI